MSELDSSLVFNIRAKGVYIQYERKTETANNQATKSVPRINVLDDFELRLPKRNAQSMIKCNKPSVPEQGAASIPS
jgi:hypothetical protein